MFSAASIAKRVMNFDLQSILKDQVVYSHQAKCQEEREIMEKIWEIYRGNLTLANFGQENILKAKKMLKEFEGCRSTSVNPIELRILKGLFMDKKDEIKTIKRRSYLPQNQTSKKNTNRFSIDSSQKTSNIDSCPSKPQIPTFRARSPMSLLDKIRIGDCDYPTSKESSNSENNVILTQRTIRDIEQYLKTERGQEINVFDFFGNTMKSSGIIKVEEQGNFNKESTSFVDLSLIVGNDSTEQISVDLDGRNRVLDSERSLSRVVTFRNFVNQ